MVPIDNNDQPSIDYEALGHPIHVFIDTSFLHRMGFPFGQPSLKPLTDRIVAGDIRLLMPDIIIKECHKHILSATTAAESIHSKFKRSSAVLRTINEESIQNSLAEIDWENAKSICQNAFNDFLETPGIEELPVNEIDLGEVVDDYFNAAPPFDGKNKKNEFPDAFAVKTLVKFSNDNGCRIAVFSGDGDWKRACTSNDSLVLCTSLADLIEQSQKNRAAEYQQIHQLLIPHKEAINRRILEDFRNLGFHWESYNWDVGEVTDVFDENIIDSPLSIVSVDEDWVGVVGEAKINFKASVTYPDPNSIYHDPEMGGCEFIGNINAIVRATETIPYSFLVNLTELRENRSELDDFTVNLGMDISFTEEEMLESISDNEDPE